MQAGVSTACLYPQLLEEALYDLALSGIQHTEIFFNSDSELRRTFVDNLARIMRLYGVTCPSVHPFACPMEPMMLFSSYERRVEDMIDYYKRTFDIMGMLGARIFVFHGNHKSHAVEPALYCERFLRLVQAGREAGILVAQENVDRCQSGSLSFLREMKRQLGDDARFVLDVKQAVRAGESPVNMLHLLGSHVVHVHLSDHGERGVCLLPGQGEFRIRSFLELLYSYSPDCSVMLELYRENFRTITDLLSSYRMLGSMIARIAQESAGRA